MIKRFALLLCVLALCLTSLAFADEGMWLFNAFPKDKVQAKYGFAPDQAWLDHVRLSSARAPNGSSSFVSPDGLIFTNHHIAQECVHDLSTNGKDYMKNGFYAPTRAEEPKCPGLNSSCWKTSGRHCQSECRSQARYVNRRRRQGAA